MQQELDHLITFIFEWVSGALFFLAVITFIIYWNIRHKSFFYYALHALILAIGFGFKGYNRIYDVSVDYSLITFHTINWAVQFIYYFFYVQFVRTFFELKKNFPKFDRFVFGYNLYMGIVCALFLIYGVLYLEGHANPNIIYNGFVLYFYTPVFVLFSAYTLYKGYQLNIAGKKMIVSGAVFYSISAVTAMFLVVSNNVYFPLGIYIIGIIIEFTFFASALGLKVSQAYNQNEQYQKQLINQLEKNKQLAEDNNRMLNEKLESFTKLELKREVANNISRLKAKVFRTQMNSHFIFNTLNSLKGTIVKDEKDKSIALLNKFSRLIRNILSNSEEKEIPLSKELEITEIYMAIENLRLNNSIDFYIHIKNEEPLTTLAKVPPFIMQPFVENAIWHGLAGKEGKKQLKIVIEKKGESLCFTITDNGLGMYQAMEMQKEKPLRHKSMGIDITRQRLQIFAQESDSHYELELENIGTKQRSRGTKVLVKLPFKI